MACSAVVFLFVPHAVLAIYTNQKEVIDAGVPLLALAAAFQIFDGIQTISAGALRVLGETRGPMLANFSGYWLFGLPLGYALCFWHRRGVFGLWTGLTLALILIALALLAEWWIKSRRLQIA